MLLLPRRVRALDNDIQPLQPLAQGRALATSGTVTKSTAIDSTCIEAHRSAHGGKGAVKGAENQVIGPSRGGQTTKIHQPKSMP